jgi:hypothetical protein
MLAISCSRCLRRHILHCSAMFVFPFPYCVSCVSCVCLLCAPVSALLSSFILRSGAGKRDQSKSDKIAQSGGRDISPRSGLKVLICRPRSLAEVQALCRALHCGPMTMKTLDPSCCQSERVSALALWARDRIPCSLLLSFSSDIRDRVPEDCLDRKTASNLRGVL